MSGLTGHLVRRALSVAHDQYQNAASGNGEIRLSKEATVVLAVTVLFFSLWMFAIKYTYLAILGTLAIVESPQTEIRLAVDLLEDGQDKKGLLEPEVTIVKPQPITAKICTATMHLRAKAGYWSRFRGMSLFMVYSFVRNIIVHFVSVAVMGNWPAGRLLAHFVAEVVLCRLEMTWIHIVISEPSQLAWYKRVPRGWKPYKNIAPAAALKSAASQLVLALPAIYACHSKLGLFHPQGQLSQADAQAILVDSLITLGIYLTLVVLIEIPATVTFVRVAASMLPEQDEAIVPFDRTFNGKVVPAVLGGSGKIGIVEAWRSFDRSSRLRLLKLIVKVTLIQTAVIFLGMGIVIGELKVLMGDDFDRMVEQGKMIVKG